MPPLFAFVSLGAFELLGFCFCIWMIYECATRERDFRTKLLWLLFICLVPPVGPLVYFFVRVVKVGGER
jgi:hypothetical protein